MSRCFAALFLAFVFSDRLFFAAVLFLGSPVRHSGFFRRGRFLRHGCFTAGQRRRNLQVCGVFCIFPGPSFPLCLQPHQTFIPVLHVECQRPEVIVGILHPGLIRIHFQAVLVNQAKVVHGSSGGNGEKDVRRRRGFLVSRNGKTVNPGGFLFLPFHKVFNRRGDHPNRIRRLDPYGIVFRQRQKHDHSKPDHKQQCRQNPQPRMTVVRQRLPILRQADSGPSLLQGAALMRFPAVNIPSVNFPSGFPQSAGINLHLSRGISDRNPFPVKSPGPVGFILRQPVDFCPPIRVSALRSERTVLPTRGFVLRSVGTVFCRPARRLCRAGSGSLRSLVAGCTIWRSCHAARFRRDSAVRTLHRRLIRRRPAVRALPQSIFSGDPDFHRPAHRILRRRRMQFASSAAPGRFLPLFIPVDLFVQNASSPLR